jgi:DNA adenine methylase
MSAASQVSTVVHQRIEAGPFLKWAGGKGQILPQLAKFFPDKFGRYFEPFAGSSAVFFHLARERGPFPATLVDLNAELINCFETVRDHLGELIPKLRYHEGKHEEKYYYKLRSTKPDSLQKIERAARFIYLNKTCYNGLYRVNSRGEFNVPIGSYKNPKIFDERNLNGASLALRGISLMAGHFSIVRQQAKAGDFIYFDPPYYTESSGFTGYAVAASGQADFSAFDHLMLRNVTDELLERGCHVVVSNSDTRFIRHLYRGYKRHGVEARRFINCNGSGRQPVRELVITGR